MGGFFQQLEREASFGGRESNEHVIHTQGKSLKRRLRGQVLEAYDCF